MVFFLNSKVKTHTEDALQYIFDENKEKIVILGYSIVSRRSPQPWDSLYSFEGSFHIGILPSLYHVNTNLPGRKKNLSVALPLKTHKQESGNCMHKLPPAKISF
jgi:hypothetical protein